GYTPNVRHRENRATGDGGLVADALAAGADNDEKPACHGAPGPLRAGGGDKFDCRREAYSPACMGGTRTSMRVGFSLAAVMLVLAMLGFTGSASAHTSCAQIGTVYGIP